MKTCIRCHKTRRDSQMSLSKKDTAGWCIPCALAVKDILRPKPKCIKCKKVMHYHEKSRSNGATAGWCMACVAKFPPTREQTHTRGAASAITSPADLVAFRARLGLSQKVLAARIGASVPAISSWEQGHTKIPLYISFALSATVAGLPPFAGF